MERGQATPIVAALLVVAGVVALVVGELGAAAVQRARARTAADAAALAGAAEGEAAARRLAGANGAEVVSFEADGNVVSVVVRYREATARATAEAEVLTPEGYAPALAAALARAAQLLGRPVAVDAVDPDGLGFTVDPSVGDDLITISRQTGLCRKGDGAHPVHFAPCPPSSPG